MHPPGPVPVCWWPSALPFARFLLGKTTTCSRFISYWWFGTKWRRQILCIGAGITLLRIIPIWSPKALLPIMPSTLLRIISPKAVFIDFFAWSRSLLWYHNFGGSRSCRYYAPECSVCWFSQKPQSSFYRCFAWSRSLWWYHNKLCIGWKIHNDTFGMLKIQNDTLCRVKMQNDTLVISD